MFSSSYLLLGAGGSSWRSLIPSSFFGPCWNLQSRVLLNLAQVTKFLPLGSARSPVTIHIAFVLPWQPHVLLEDVFASLDFPHYLENCFKFSTETTHILYILFWTFPGPCADSEPFIYCYLVPTTQMFSVPGSLHGTHLALDMERQLQQCFLLNRAVSNSVEEWDRNCGIEQYVFVTFCHPQIHRVIIVSYRIRIPIEKHGHIGSPFSDTAIWISEAEGGLIKIPCRTDSFADLSIWVCLKMLCTPLYPMVLLIIIPMKNGYFIGNINPTFSDLSIFSRHFCHLLPMKLVESGSTWTAPSLEKPGAWRFPFIQ